MEGKSIGILTARQTEIVDCNWEGRAAKPLLKSDKYDPCFYHSECKVKNIIQKLYIFAEIIDTYPKLFPWPEKRRKISLE